MDAREAYRKSSASNLAQFPEALNLAIEQIRDASEQGLLSCCPSLGDASPSVAENVCQILRAKGYEAFSLPRRSAQDIVHGDQQISVKWNNLGSAPKLKKENQNSWWFRLKAYFERNFGER